MNLKPGGTKHLRRSLASNSKFGNQNQVYANRIGTLSQSQVRYFRQ